MIKKLLLFLLIIPTLSSFHIIEKSVPAFNNYSPDNENLLVGNWALVKIESPDSIDIIPRSNEGVCISSEKTTAISYQRVALKDYLEKQLMPCITKFVFNKDNTFSFYRKERLTHSGKWFIRKNELVFEFKSGESTNTKLNKIVSINATELILESESHNKPVVFHFAKSEN